MEEARKDIAEEYGCAPEKVDICPLTLLPNEEASAVLNSKADNAADFARTILSEAEDSLTSYAAMGRAILEALASNDADKLLTALTGWSAHDLLVKVGALRTKSRSSLRKKKRRFSSVSGNGAPVRKASASRPM